MATIKIILVRNEGERLEVVRFPSGYLELVLDVDADSALEGIRRHFYEHWGLKVHALRWLFPEDFVISGNALQSPFLVVYVESSGAVPTDSFENQSGTLSEHTKDLCPYLTAAVTPYDSESWSQPNWLPNTSTWILAHFHGTRGISQVRTCPNGAVVRIDCVNGTYYLKTQLEPLAYESALLGILNHHIPGACPRVLPIRPDLNTHVTEGITGSPLDTQGSSHVWPAVLRDVARIQIEAADVVSELCHAGVPHHGVAALGTGIAAMLDSVIASQIGSPNELTAEEVRKVSSLISKTLPDFESLYRSDLPDTLVHGDLNRSNAFRTETGGTVLIDWALSRITHPFFILGSALFGPCASSQRKQPDYDDLCNAYLDPWLDFQAYDRLRAALDAASRLFWIDSTIAVSFLSQPGHVRYLANLPRFLRATLRAYELVA
ncbi:MAG TPA: phosphotransferase [Terriglobales bacterium]|nr:phosphotransferase [Terriglobales bacterium]